MQLASLAWQPQCPISTLAGDSRRLVSCRVSQGHWRLNQLALVTQGLWEGTGPLLPAQMLHDLPGFCHRQCIGSYHSAMCKIPLACPVDSSGLALLLRLEAVCLQPSRWRAWPGARPGAGWWRGCA